MHLDFVVADPETMVVVLAVELDDRSHLGAEAGKRDLFKDSALVSARVPLLRVRASRQYEVGELGVRIAGLVGR